MQEAVDKADKARFEGTKMFFVTNRGYESFDAAFLISNLLVYVAKGNGSISELETGEMLDLLSSRLGASYAEAMEYLTAAVMNLANDWNILSRLRQISAKLSQEEKETVFSMALDTVMVNDTLDPGETRSLIHAGQILGLSEDRIYAELGSLAKK